MQQTKLSPASKELLKTALLGLEKHQLSFEEMPPVLHSALQALMQQEADPLEAFVQAANLVFAYERTHSANYITTFTPEEWAQLQAAANDPAHPVAPELKAKLLRAQQHHAPIPLLLSFDDGTASPESYPLPDEIGNSLYNLYSLHRLAKPEPEHVESGNFIAPLAALRHLHFTVPQEAELKFAFSYLFVYADLPQHLKLLPLEFLSSSGRVLLSLLTALELQMLLVSPSATTAYNFRRCEDLFMDPNAITLQLDLLFDRQKTIARIKNRCCREYPVKWQQQIEIFQLLLDNSELEILLECIMARAKPLDSQNLKELLALLQDNWFKVLNCLYQQGYLPQQASTTTPSASAAETAANATVASLPLPASAYTDQHHQYSLYSRLEAWLLPLAQNDASSDISSKAAYLLWLLPNSRWAQASLSFLRFASSPVLDAHSAQLKQNSSYKRTDAEIASLAAAAAATDAAATAATEAATDDSLQPPIQKAFLYELKQLFAKDEPSRKPDLRDYSQHYMVLLTFVLPPALWFEILHLPRSGDDTHDADALMQALAQYYDTTCSCYSINKTHNRSAVLKYFVLRLRMELGAAYSHAFYRYFMPLLSPHELPQMVAFASYSERESISFVSAPFKQLELGSHNMQYLPELFMFHSNALCGELPLRWGPKFSKFYFDVLVAYCTDTSSGYLAAEPDLAALELNALALSLDVEQREQARERMQKLLQKMQQQKARQYALLGSGNPVLSSSLCLSPSNKAIYEARFNWYSRNVHFLESLLAAYTYAQQVEKLRADALKRTSTLQRAEATTDAGTGDRAVTFKADQTPNATSFSGSAEVSATLAADRAASVDSVDSEDSAPLPPRMAIPLLPKKASTLKREEYIAAGAAEIKVWIKDSLRTGLLQSLAHHAQDSQRLQLRMVDAKSPQLATILDSTGYKVSNNDEARIDYLKLLLRIYMLVAAFEQREQLPAAWQGELSRLVDKPPKIEEVIAANHQAFAGKELPLETLLVVTDTFYDNYYRGKLHKQICYSFERQDFVYFVAFKPRHKPKADAEPQEQPLAKGTVLRAKVYLYPGLTVLPRVLLKERQVLVEPKLVKQVKESNLIQSENLLFFTPEITQENATNGAVAFVNGDINTSNIPVDLNALTTTQGHRLSLKSVSSFQEAFEVMGRFFLANPFAKYCPVIIDHVHLARMVGEHHGAWYLYDRTGKARSLLLTDTSFFGYREHMATYLSLTRGHDFTAVVLLNEKKTNLVAICYEGKFLSMPITEPSLFGDWDLTLLWD